MDHLEERLAEEVRKYENLYNPSLTEFKDSKMALNSWREISANVGVKVEECTKLWRKLRDKYVRQKKAMRSSRGDAGGKKVRAVYYSLSWLGPHIKHRETSSNYDTAQRKREREQDQKEQAEMEVLAQRRTFLTQCKKEDEDTRFAATLVDVLRKMPPEKRLEARRCLYNIAVDFVKE